MTSKFWKVLAASVAITIPVGGCGGGGSGSSGSDSSTGSGGSSTSSGGTSSSGGSSSSSSSSGGGTGNTIFRLMGNLPFDIIVADGELRRDEDVPHFHFPTVDSDRLNTQAGLESQFPRLAPWAECITKRRTQNASISAACYVGRFELVELNVASGARSVIADFDLSAQRRNAPIRCGFNTESPPVRTASFCAGANYRREDASGRLCWYNWCLAPGQPNVDGIATMTGGFITSDGRLSVNVANTPKQVSHWWTQTGGVTPHPRTRASQGYRYFLEVDLYTVGDAVFRVGADRWIDTEGEQKFLCNRLGQASANCEIYFSNWLRDTSGNTAFKTLVFQLDG